MAILLAILKMIGIVLLIILAIIFVLLCMLLFVPVRYRVNGKYRDSAPECVAVISYLLHIIVVKVVYEDDLKAVLKLFGIPIMKLYPMEKKSKKTVSKESGDDREESSEDEKSDEDTDKNHDEDKAKEDTKKDLLSSVRHLTDVLNDPSVTGAWETCKKRAGKLLKHIMPRKVRICVRYGLDDPYMVSIIHAVSNVFYIYLGENIKLIPVYEGKYLDAIGKARGYIMLFPVLWHGLAVMFNSDCRRFYRLVKKKKKA